MTQIRHFCVEEKEMFYALKAQISTTAQIFAAAVLRPEALLTAQFSDATKNADCHCNSNTG